MAARDRPLSRNQLAAPVAVIGAGFSGTVRPRGETDVVPITAQGLIDATGFGRLAETDDPLVQSLVARGPARSGPFGFGLDATPDSRVLGPQFSALLWSIGPLLRGVL